MKKLLLLIGYLLVLGCGVRGDPLPPETPAELGRGRPNYKRATENINLEDVAEPDRHDADEDEEEKKNSDEEVF